MATSIEKFGTWRQWGGTATQIDIRPPRSPLQNIYITHTHALYTLVSLSVLTTLASNKLGIPLASDRDMDPDQQSSRLFGNQERSRPCCSKDTRQDTAAEKMTAYSENAMTQTKTLLVKDDVYVCECEWAAADRVAGAGLVFCWPAKKERHQLL